MYLISQVSKITGLTKKALRYYDEQDILKPSFRDEGNQYRYYDEKDLKKAQLINLLRSFDFSISEIKDTLNMAENEEDLSYILKEKIEHIENNISKEKALIKKMDHFLQPLPQVYEEKSYDITIEEIGPVMVAGLRIQDSYNRIGKYVSELYKVVKGNADGNLINCYYDEDCVEIADMELCIPIRKKIADSSVSCKLLPAVNAVCTTHVGNYETLYLAYKALFHYVNVHKLSVLSPSREIYLKGPGMIFRGNPDKYITKIILPFEIK